MPKSRLTAPELTAAIARLPDWRLINGKLNRAFKFKGFVDGFAFMKKVAFVAERMDHQLEFFNGYNFVTIDLVTNDVHGISNLDIELATKINNL